VQQLASRYRVRRYRQQPLRLRVWYLLFALPLLLPLFATAAEPLERVRLQLQWKHQFEYAGFYAAIAQGYYADAGLDVELIEFAEGVDIVADVVNGDVEYALGHSSVIADYLNGAPLVLVANFLKRSPIAIVAQPEINTPADLAGKRLMATNNGSREPTLAVMLDKFGVTLDALEVVPPTFSVRDFVEHKVDAMVVFTTNEIHDIDQAGKRYNLFHPALYGIIHYDVNLITSRHELRHHPDRVKRFRDATIRGWEYAITHREEVIDLILNRYNSQQKSRASLQFEARQIIDAMMPNVTPVGSINRDRLDMIAADYAHLKLVTGDHLSALDRFIYVTPHDPLQLAPEELSYLANRRPIRYCIDPDWMPYEQLVDGEHRGMSRDYIELFTQKLGIPFHLVATTTWKQSLQFVRDRQCDLVSLAMANQERQHYLNFTRPYIRFPLVIATRNEELFVSDLNEVKDRAIGIVSGYAFIELLRYRYPGIRLVEVASLADGLEQVSRGKLFGVIDSLVPIGMMLQRTYIGDLKVAGRFDDYWELGVGIRNDDPMLLQIMNKVIDAITPEERQRIANHWITVQMEPRIDYDLAIKIAIAAGFIILIFAYHTTTQSRLLHQLNQAHQLLQEKSSELERLSITDKLSGLYNRARLDQILEQELNRFERYRIPFSVILLDIDWFKTINDTYGHLEGDRMIVELSKLLTQTIRNTDRIGRWGGEEFMVICPSSDLDSAAILAERLRQQVAAHNFGFESPQSISLGIAEVAPGCTIDTLISMADRALYTAKQQGRNRVAISTTPPLP